MLIEREREGLKLVAEDCETVEVAECLSPSAKTVEKHRTNATCKLDGHSLRAVTACATCGGSISQ